MYIHTDQLPRIPKPVLLLYFVLITETKAIVITETKNNLKNKICHCRGSNLGLGDRESDANALHHRRFDRQLR